jgi:hypothetical protein
MRNSFHAVAGSYSGETSAQRRQGSSPHGSQARSRVPQATSRSELACDGAEARATWEVPLGRWRSGPSAGGSGLGLGHRCDQASASACWSSSARTIASDVMEPRSTQHEERHRCPEDER